GLEHQGGRLPIVPIAGQGRGRLLRQRQGRRQEPRAACRHARMQAPRADCLRARAGAAARGLGGAFAGRDRQPAAQFAPARSRGQASRQVTAPPPSLPRLTQARAPLTREVVVVNEHGAAETVSIPAERPLTIYVDRREVVTLMTLGAMPELLVLGYLRNERLIRDVSEVLSIMVDWEGNAAAVETRHGITDIDARTAQRVVTTGCGQGSVFGGLMQELDEMQLDAHAQMTQTQLYGLLNAIRLQETTYKSAGSVHGCALFR